ncbi:translation initiation factor IF-2-like isoform X2 [Lagopus muta]|uniref:translation initiation factor IF-2-like isoform X2 n=1 Tax=Lagopus muta TaxID=64668 RepID=UPI0020A18CC5|nr:translation initiation factor IF-2-like isoform X2 [Lagopus muta]
MAVPCPQAGAPDAALKGAARIGAADGAPGGTDGRGPAPPRSAPARPGPHLPAPSGSPGRGCGRDRGGGARRRAGSRCRGGARLGRALCGWQPVGTRAVASGLLAVTPLSTALCRNRSRADAALPDITELNRESL